MQNIESQVLPLLLNPPIYPEINFPAKPVMKINNLSDQKCQPPPPQNQMVVPLLSLQIPVA